MFYTLILSFLISFNLLANSPDFKAHFAINGKSVKGMNPAMVMPGVPTLIEVYFTDPRTGKRYTEFKKMHGKFMHMVIANKDLSVFKHIHPYYDPITGHFAMVVNMPYSDPDNQDATKTLDEPGMYMVMADVIVKGVGMRMDHAMVMVHGQNQESSLKLDLSENGIITKYFNREDKDEEPSYKAIFSFNTITGCSGSIVNFEIEMFNKVNGAFVPMLDFQPWLSEAAHSVWLSEGYMKHMHHQMPFAHMHSPFILDDDNDDTNDRVLDHILRFNFHDQGIMLKGKQKMWVQFKHLGKIMKIPFIFEYNPTPARDC